MHTENTHKQFSTWWARTHATPIIGWQWLHCTSHHGHWKRDGIKNNMLLLRNRNATPKRNNNERLSAAEAQNATQNASPERNTKCPNHTNLYLETISLKTQFRNARTAWEVFKNHPKRSRNASSKRGPKRRSILCVLKRRTQNAERKTPKRSSGATKILYIYIYIYMTPAWDPKQCFFLEASWKRYHEGGILEEGPLRRNHGAEIIQES